MICKFIVKPIVVVLLLIQEVLTAVQELVCTITQSLVTAAEWVQSWACGKKWWQVFTCWLAWTLVIVTKVVDFLVCDLVVTWIVTLVNVAITYTVTVMLFLCIWLDFLAGAWLCLFKNKQEQCIRICVVVASKDNGSTVISHVQVKDLLDAASKILAQCNVRLIRCKMVALPYESRLSHVNADNLFWRPKLIDFFRRESCSCCDQVTLFFTDDLQNASGWTVMGETWAVIGVNPSTYGSTTQTDLFAYDAQTIAHEIGHICLLNHTPNKPDNLMYNGDDYSITNPPTNLTDSQCCRLKRSRFTKRSCKCPTI